MLLHRNTGNVCQIPGRFQVCGRPLQVVPVPFLVCTQPAGFPITWSSEGSGFFVSMYHTNIFEPGHKNQKMHICGCYRGPCGESQCIDNSFPHVR
jgi:hypothetical protein